MYFIRSLWFFPAICKNLSFFLFLLEISTSLSLNTQPIGGDKIKAKKLVELYNGDYTYIERKPLEDKRYHDSLSKSIAIEEKLATLVDKEIFDLIEKELEYQTAMSDVEMEYAFVEGFSLAVALLLEAISEK